MSATSKPKVFSDFHHSGLFRGLHLLFEKRLGGQLFRPVGLDWYERGLWSIYPSIDTAKQYLTLDQRYKPTDGTPQLNQIKDINPLYYEVYDPGGDFIQKAVTFEQFMGMTFDIVIATIPQHLSIYKRLANIKDARFIFQIGNAWPVEADTAPNIMSSARINNVPSNINFIEYHQEFPLDIYHFAPPAKSGKIYSFINCLGNTEIYKPDWELFLELERLLPEYEFKSFGGQCRDGWCNGDWEVANRTREADLVFHCKTYGDGFGYGMFTAAACGRPIITRLTDYKGKLAEPLIGDGETSINVDSQPPQQVANRIKNVMETTKLEKMGKEIYETFKEHVNYDHEEERIRDFLARLQ